MSKKLLSVLMSTLLLGQFVSYVPANAAPYRDEKLSKKERKRLKEEKRENRNNTIRKFALFGVGTVAFAVGTGALYNELKESSENASACELCNSIVKLYHNDPTLVDEFLKFNARSVYATAKITDAIEKLQVVFKCLRDNKPINAGQVKDAQKALKEIGCGAFFTSQDCIALMEYAKQSYKLDSYLKHFEQVIRENMGGVIYLTDNDRNDTRSAMLAFVRRQTLTYSDQQRLYKLIDDLYKKAIVVNPSNGTACALTLKGQFAEARQRYIDFCSEWTLWEINNKCSGKYLNPNDWKEKMDEAKKKCEDIISIMKRVGGDYLKYEICIRQICDAVETFAKDYLGRRYAPQILHGARDALMIRLNTYYNI